MARIDSHQHFWRPTRGDYGWMPADDPVLTRPYAPQDLAAELDAAGIAQTVLVQAAPSVAETEYLLGIADATPRVAAVVGWIDFEQPRQIDLLRRFAAHPKFVGLRPMIQDIADDDWMLRDDVQWAYQAIIDLDLTFDALGFPRHLQNFHTLLTRYPDMRAVLDHCLKPRINDPDAAGFDHWAAGMRRLAGETGAYCKLSGLVTEADSDWSAEALRPWVDQVVEIFGPARIMWGSDWPVCRLRCEYGAWFDTARALTAELDEAGRARVFGETARDFYRLSA